METEKYFIAHDESGDVRTDAFFAVGFTFVPELNLRDFIDELRAIRKEEGYLGEIHFNRLRNGPGRQYGEKAATASRWISAIPYFAQRLGVRFYVLVVNRDADSFDRRQQAKPDHLAYNRFTRMGLEGALRWLFPNEHLALHLVSDGKFRRLPGGDDEFAAGDNFVEYLPRAVERRTRNERAPWPSVRFDGFEVIDTSAQHGSRGSEMVQFTDVLTSATRAAISGLCGRSAGKVAAARQMVSIVRDVSREPWDQEFGLHRLAGFAEFQGARWADPVVARLGPELMGQGQLFG